MGLTRVAVVPHLTTRGPNGFWVIERGPQHPVVTAFEGCDAWIITGEKGTPVFLESSRPEGPYSSRAVTALDICQSRADADLLIEELSDDDLSETGAALTARHVHGAALLEILTRCDLLMTRKSADNVVYVDDVVFTDDGWHRALNSGYESNELTRCTPEELAALFRRPAE